MTSCKRFEEEGLERLERGEPLDAHFDECEDCLEARRSYEKLKNLLGDMDEDAAPRDGWQDAVLDRVHAAPSSPGTQWQRWAMAAGLAAIAVVATLLLSQTDTPPASGGIEVAIVSGGATYRGETATVGDRLVVTAETAGLRVFAIRVYRDAERLVFACPGRDSCDHRGDTVSAEIPIQAIGEYEAVLFRSQDLLPAATGDLDDDVTAARHSGATVIPAAVVRVR